MSTRWQDTSAPRGDDYDARWRALAAGGQSIHGEADLVETLLRGDGRHRVLDAGCGTGRVAIELSARGLSVVGVDVDAAMLATARAKQPELPWLEADLVDLATAVDTEFDLVLLAGNVMIFLAPDTEDEVLRGAARHASRRAGCWYRGSRCARIGCRSTAMTNWPSRPACTPSRAGRRGAARRSPAATTPCRYTAGRQS